MSQNTSNSNVVPLSGNNQQNQNTQTTKKRVPPERQLTELIKDFDLFKDENDVTYIEIVDYDSGFRPIGERIVRINSTELREYLVDLMYQNFYKFPSKNVLESMLMHLSYQAKKDGTVIEVFNRLGSDVNGNIYIDLTDTNKQMVKITKRGWTVGHYPVVFTKHGHTAPLPIPQPGGNLKDLLRFIPIAAIREQCLLLCWLVASMIPNIERCFLLLEGPPGSAKSAVANRLKSLIDPMIGNRLTLTSKVVEVAQQLGQHCIPNFDNISQISEAISDLFCLCYSKAVYSKKALYTDDGNIIFNMSGNIIFTTIGLKRVKPDFMERTYKVEIPKRYSYASQKKLNEDFEQLEPKLFGALLDTLVAVLNKVDQLPVPTKYRTVDFDHYCAATAEVLGYGQDTFWDARAHVEAIKYKGMIKSIPLLQALLSLLSVSDGYWIGCMNELLHDLKLHADNPAALPKAPNSLSGALNSPNTKVELDAAGIIVTALGNKHCHVYEITLRGGQPPTASDNDVPFPPQDTSAIADLVGQTISGLVDEISDSERDYKPITTSPAVTGDGEDTTETSDDPQDVVQIPNLLESISEPVLDKFVNQALDEMDEFIKKDQEGIGNDINPFLIEDDSDDGDQDQ